MTEIKLPDKKSKKKEGEQTQTNSIVSIPPDDKPTQNELTPFIIEFNTTLLSDSKEEDQRSDMQNMADNQRFFQVDDISKFDNLQTFIRCLLVVFSGKPKKLFEFIVENLLPIYKNQIKAPRDQIVNSPTLSAEIREPSGQPLKFLLYLGLNLAGKIDFNFLDNIFMSQSGLNWKATCFKNKKTMSYNTDQLILDCISMSKLRQNKRITSQNLLGITLDFDEFLMFICQIIQFMKNNQVCPKSWLEQTMEQIVPSIINKIVYSVFKIKKPKGKKAAVSDDLGDLMVNNTDQAVEEDLVDSSDEDF